METPLWHNWVEKEGGGSMRVSKDDMRIQLHMKLLNRNIILFENEIIQFVILNTISKQSIKKNSLLLISFFKIKVEDLLIFFFNKIKNL